MEFYLSDTCITVIGTIAGSVVGGLIAGLFTFLGVRKTLKHQDMINKKEELKHQYDNRPRLEIIKFTNCDKIDVNNHSDLDCLFLEIKDVKFVDGHAMFEYDKKHLDLKNLFCYEYVFKNIGKTEIDGICFVSNIPKSAALINLENREFLIKNKTLSYEAWSKKRFIKPGETIRIKVYYLNNKLVYSPISASIVIYLQDINENIWTQPFFCPTEVVENSTRSNYSLFKNDRDISLAIECFKNPKMW